MSLQYVMSYGDIEINNYLKNLDNCHDLKFFVNNTCFFKEICREQNRDKLILIYNFLKRNTRCANELFYLSCKYNYLCKILFKEDHITNDIDIYQKINHGFKISLENGHLK